jgi:hypothetical protein
LPRQVVCLCSQASNVRIPKPPKAFDEIVTRW